MKNNLQDSSVFATGPLCLLSILCGFVMIGISKVYNVKRLREKKKQLSGKHSFIHKIPLQGWCIYYMVVVITGASSGIGEALAHKFYSLGCKLILASRRLDQLERVKIDLISSHKMSTVHVPVIQKLDLDDLDSFPDFVKRVMDIYGHVDILVNNAGISSRGRAMDTILEVYIRLMKINYTAQVAITKLFAEHMVKRRSGHIVFMLSIQAYISIPGRSPYGTTKHALNSFGDILRCELHRYNVNVSSIYPSNVNTMISKNALNSNGEIYGETDIRTQKGYSPESVAEKTINCIALNKSTAQMSSLYESIFIYSLTILPSFHRMILRILDRKLKV